MTTASQYDAIDFFDHVFNNVLRTRGTEQSCKPQAKAAQQEVRLIRVDVSETASQYLVSADLPGVRKEDIVLDIEGKLLNLSAQTVAPQVEVKEGQSAPEARRTLLGERFQGKLTRRLQLPEEVDVANVQASFTNGVLELVLPKQTPRGTRRVEIQ